MFVRRVEREEGERLEVTKKSRVSLLLSWSGFTMQIFQKGAY